MPASRSEACWRTKRRLLTHRARGHRSASRSSPATFVLTDTIQKSLRRPLRRRQHRAPTPSCAARRLRARLRPRQRSRIPDRSSPRSQGAAASSRPKAIMQGFAQHHRGRRQGARPGQGPPNARRQLGPRTRPDPWTLVDGPRAAAATRSCIDKDSSKKGDFKLGRHGQDRQHRAEQEFTLVGIVRSATRDTPGGRDLRAVRPTTTAQEFVAEPGVIDADLGARRRRRVADSELAARIPKAGATPTSRCSPASRSPRRTSPTSSTA